MSSTHTRRKWAIAVGPIGPGAFSRSDVPDGAGEQVTQHWKLLLANRSSLVFRQGLRRTLQTDIQTGKVVWQVPQSGNVDSWGGVLSTAGNVVFFGDDSGALAAADARTGNVL